MVVEPYITNTLFESDDSLALESDYDTDFAFAIACEKLLVQCEESKRLSRTFVGTLGKATRQALFHATVSIQSDAVVAVIIDRIVFIGSFLFYCLLLNHNVPTNPNRMTNFYKLFSLLQLTTTFAQCVRYFDF